MWQVVVSRWCTSCRPPYGASARGRSPLLSRPSSRSSRIRLSTYRLELDDNIFPSRFLYFFPECYISFSQNRAIFCKRSERYLLKKFAFSKVKKIFALFSPRLWKMPFPKIKTEIFIFLHTFQNVIFKILRIFSNLLLFPAFFVIATVRISRPRFAHQALNITAESINSKMGEKERKRVLDDLNCKVG